MVAFLWVSFIGGRFMHELSIAKCIVEEASKNIAPDQKVLTIYLKVGALSGVVKECLEFVFEEAAKDSALEGSELIIEKVPLKMLCHKCHEITHSEDIVILCQSCYHTNVEVLEGKELLISKMEVI